MRQIFRNRARKPTDAGVNEPISDSATFQFTQHGRLRDAIDGTAPAGYLYARVETPTTRALADDLAVLEGAERGAIFSSGMAALAATLFQLLETGDEVVASPTVYGGTYAFLAALLPRLGIRSRFVDFGDASAVEAAVTEHTKALVCETLSNPWLAVPDLPAVANLATRRGLTLIVDNTFTPLAMRPIAHGAHVVYHSLTKYIGGMADGIGGAVAGPADLVERLLDPEFGAAVLLGGVLDSSRAAAFTKSLLTLPVRFAHQSAAALRLVEALRRDGCRVRYPGLAEDPTNARFDALRSSNIGYGGVLTIDLGTTERAEAYLDALADRGLVSIAVSLGYVRTIACLPASSTASELPAELRSELEMSDGTIRVSVGLEPDPEAFAAEWVEVYRRCR